MVRKLVVFVRVNEEEKKMLEEVAKYYGIAEADVVRIALREFMKTHGLIQR